MKAGPLRKNNFFEARKDDNQGQGGGGVGPKWSDH